MRTAHAASAPPAASARVLIVDDDPDLRGAFSDVLEGEGYSVTIAGDGIEALAAVAGTDFDMVLFDVNMPRLDGAAAARILRRAWPDAYIVMHTSLPEAQVRQQFDDYDAYFSKPLDVERFLSAVARMLR